MLGFNRKAAKVSGSAAAMEVRRGCKWGWEEANTDQVATAAAVAAARPLHCPVMRWERVPGVAGMHCGTWQVPVGSPLQYLLNQQVLYRPLAILNWTVAFLHSSWDAEQEVRTAEGQDKDIWERRRKAREGSSSPAERSFAVQYAVIWRFTALFHLP